MTGSDFLIAVDERCGAAHNVTELSITSATATSVLMVFTIPLNSMIIYSLLKERKRKYSSLFYKLLLNIAVADLLTGVIADPLAIGYLIRESLNITLTLAEKYIQHVMLFLTDAAALITLSFLSIERFIALVFPIKHYNGIKRRTRFILVFSAWPFAFLLVLPYFQLNFIKHLLVFSSINIVVTIMSLIVTTIAYKQKLKPKVNKQNDESSSRIDSSITTTKRSGKVDSDKSLVSNPSNNRSNLIPKLARIQHRATRTFILMLCVFIATYLPTAFTMIYMNVCRHCGCVAIHIMRDISILSILSSSVFRPLNFILTLKYLRASVIRTFKKEKERINLSSGTVQ